MTAPASADTGARRIVSLLPAATDIVHALGLGDRLVGRTHECDWPPAEMARVPVVTTTSLDPESMSSREISVAVRDGGHAGSSLYGLDAAALTAAAPDLVLTQELCDVCAVSYETVSATVRRLDGPVTVLSLAPRTYDEVYACVRTVGERTGAVSAAETVVRDAADRLAAVGALVADRPPVRVVAIEWLDPVWPAGHWVPEQIAHAGGVDVLTAPGTHTAPVDWQRVVDLAPDVLLLMPCGLPIGRTVAELGLLRDLPGWSDLPAVRAGQVWALDGPAYFNRPGPRIVRGVEVLAAVLHGVDTGLTPAEARRLDR